MFEWLEAIKEFLKNLFSAGLFEKILGILLKIKDILGQIIEIIIKIKDWLFNMVRGIFIR